MLSIIQRIPRYELLFKEYLKRLPSESPDKHDAEGESIYQYQYKTSWIKILPLPSSCVSCFFSDALQIISTAGTHANNAIAKIERFKQLLEITKKLGGQIDLVHPVRKLLKEGDLKKITTSDKGDVEQHVRHMYLVRGYPVRSMVLPNDINFIIMIRLVLHENFISLTTLLVQWYGATLFQKRIGWRYVQGQVKIRPWRDERCWRR